MDRNTYSEISLDNVVEFKTRSSEARQKLEQDLTLVLIKCYRVHPCAEVVKALTERGELWLRRERGGLGYWYEQVNPIFATYDEWEWRPVH